MATTNPQLYTTTQEDIEDSQSDLEENNNEGEVVESVLTGSANEESVSVDNAQVINTDESYKNTKYIVWGIVLIIGAIAVVLFTRRAKKSDKTLLNNMIMKAPDGKKIKNKKDETVVANGAVKNNNFYNVDEEKKKIEIKNNDKVSTATPKNVASEKSEIKQKKKVTKLEPIIFKKKEKKMEDFEIEVS